MADKAQLDRLRDNKNAPHLLEKPLVTGLDRSSCSCQQQYRTAKHFELARFTYSPAHYPRDAKLIYWRSDNCDGNVIIGRIRGKLKMVKIAVSGAHGTGKTTLCEFLHRTSGAELDMAICREVPRIIIDRVGEPSFFKRGSNTVERQLLIFLYQLEEERKKGSGKNVLLCDRTPIDHLAYTLANHPKFRGSPEHTALT